MTVYSISSLFGSIIPAIVKPSPGFIVYIHKVLIVEMNSGKVVFCHLNPLVYACELEP